MNYSPVFKINHFFGGAVFATVFLFGAGALSPQAAQAASLTSVQINAIIGLLQSFGADQTTINNVQVTLGGGTHPWCHTFNTNLRFGDGYGATVAPNNQSAFQREIYYLQVVLIKEGFSIAGNETTDNSFRDSTASAITGFQEKYASDILTPNGLQHGTGYAGVATRAKLNSLYGCNGTTTPSITSLQPTSGMVGTSVTITGSGFTLTNNSVKFGAGYLNGVNSNGTRIPFTVPDGLTSCPPGAEICPKSFPQVTPDVYPVSVINANGTSNTVNFTVTAMPITLQVLSPNGGEQWQKGTAQNIKWTAPSSVSSVSIFLGQWFACLYATPRCAIAQRLYTLTASAPNDGVFEWSVGKDASGADIPAGQYTATVSAGPFSGASDKPFSIY